MDGIAPIRITDKYGAINQSGELLVDCIYDFVNVGEHGILSVETNNRFGIVDTVCGIVSEPKWDEIGTFHNNRCRVKKEGCWGFIDQTGHLTVPCSYARVENFRNDLAIVTDLNGYQWVIDPFGHILAPYMK